MDILKTFSFYLAMYFFVLYILIVIYQKMISYYNIGNKNNIWLRLNTYYISNAFYTIFMIIIYFFMGFFLFIFYRITLFNKETIIAISSDILLDRVVIYNVILFFITMNYYLKILNILFGDYLIAIHFYLSQYSWYENINEFERTRYQWISNALDNISSYFSRVTFTEEMFIKFFYMSEANKSIDVFSSKEYNFWKKVQSKPYLLSLYFFLQKIFYILGRWASLFLYYFLHSSVVLVLCYDIHQGKLYYLYYMLAIYFLLKFIRKIRDFIQVKDPVYDDIIMRYFYKNDVPYEEIRITLESENQSRKSSNMGDTISSYEEEIKRYFDNNLHVDYITDPHMTKNRKRNHNFARRLNIIFLLILGAIYNSFHHGKYFFAFSNYNISLNYLLIPVIIILFYANYKIFYHGETREKALEYKPYLWVFRIIVIFVVLPILYFILKNKLTVMSNETLFDIKDNIRFYEVFTLEDKYNYFRRYLKYLEKVRSLSEKEIIKLITEMKTIVNNDIPLYDIRTKIEELIILWSKPKRNYTLAEVWEAIQNFFYNKTKNSK